MSSAKQDKSLDAPKSSPKSLNQMGQSHFSFPKKMMNESKVSSPHLTEIKSRKRSSDSDNDIKRNTEISKDSSMQSSSTIKRSPPPLAHKTSLVSVIT